MGAWNHAGMSSVPFCIESNKMLFASFLLADEGAGNQNGLSFRRIESCGFAKAKDWYAWWFADPSKAAAHLRRLAEWRFTRCQPHRKRESHFVIAVWSVKRGIMHRMKYWKTAVSILAALSASLALAEDFKTTNGKEYKNATVTHVEPDGIVLKTKTGISKVYFTELPKEVQERFLPSPAKTGAAQRELIDLKSWVAAMANPTSFVLLFVGGASLIAAAAFAIVRSRLQ
jgi:hypothetical protein